MRQIANKFGLLYGLLLILFVPASFKIFSIQNNFSDICFSWLTTELHPFSSDSESLFLLFFILAAFAIILVIIEKQFGIFKNYQSEIQALIKLIIIYYLASRFFVYGFDKVVKSQFFLPEPNTLYTPVGLLSKDILYWTSMGASYWYNVLTGCLEILPAVLLLFNRTRTAGLLILLFVTVNVLFINIGFDISVKLYSLFLLYLILLLLAPNFRSIISFLSGKTAILNPTEKTFSFIYKPFIKASLKSFIIGLIVLDVVFYSFQSGNFNDDLAERPFLHGAYQVNHVNDLNVKRFFVHRRGFFILQYENDEFLDFALEVDETNLILTDYTNEMNKVPYQVYENGIEILFMSTILVGDKLNWKSLPAVQDEFHLIQNSN